MEDEYYLALTETRFVSPEVARRLQNVSSPELKPVAAVCAATAEDITHLLCLPWHQAYFHAESSLRELASALAGLPEQSDKGLTKQEILEKRLAKVKRDPRFEGVGTRSGQAALKYLLSSEPIRPAIRALCYSALVRSWACFEASAKDAWIASLNAEPMRLGHPAFGAVDSDGGDLSGRSISVGLLARHGFDVRRLLGTLLAEKFDFTSVKGVQEAYARSFGDAGKVRAALMPDGFDEASRTDLFHLEATRHVIVHRAGVIDDEFFRRTGFGKLGDHFEIEHRSFGRMLNAGPCAAYGIICFADSMLQAARDEPRPD